MAPVFISYRRDDGPENAQLLAQHLKRNFGEDSVFLDTSRLKPGGNFPSDLKQAVKSAKIMIVLIGPNWKGKDGVGNRLEDKKDWVRKELEIAISNQDTRIFPFWWTDRPQ